MPTKEKLREYARLTVRMGANVAKGQYVMLSCPVVAAEFGRMIVEEAFEAGARDVIVTYTDEQTSRLRYLGAELAEFESIPDWQAESRNLYARLGGCVITVIAEDPDIMRGVPREKLTARARAADKAFHEFYDKMDKSEMRWTLVAYPFDSWAEKVFPDEPSEIAVEKLWNAVLETVRIGDGDVVSRWKTHDLALKERCKKLNDAAFDALHFTNSLGTDLTVGLAKSHIWLGGSDLSPDGVEFFANMPTEECFTMPDCHRVDGVVCSSMPLSHNGEMIDRFSLTFSDGVVTSHTAETGYDALAAVLDTDEGSRRLGEVALIPHSSPISKMKILFYNTLFDENASCHLALGSCYPNTLRGGELMSEEELLAAGGNHSAKHVDFMFGTQDMSVEGISGQSRVKVFENGEFVL